MELSFSELRAKEVVNTQDGRKLGRVCDVVLCYPENRWIGLVVPSGRGFGKRQELFLELKNIVKITVRIDFKSMSLAILSFISYLLIKSSYNTVITPLPPNA